MWQTCCWHACENSKKENNRYSIGLLLKEDTITLPNHRSLAIPRMNSGMVISTSNSITPHTTQWPTWINLEKFV